MGDPTDDVRNDDARQQGGDPFDACPFLGLTDDDRSHFSFPSSEHRCHSEPKRVYVGLAHQGTYCLTARHVRCFRYYAPDSVNASPAHVESPTPRPSAALPPRSGFGQLVETPKGWVPVATTPVDGPRFAPDAGIAAGAAAAAAGAGDQGGTPGHGTPGPTEPAPADGLWANADQGAGPAGPAGEDAGGGEPAEEHDPWASRPPVAMPDEEIAPDAPAQQEPDDLPAPVLPAWAFGAAAAGGAGSDVGDASGDGRVEPQPHEDPAWPQTDEDAFREEPAADSALWAFAERQAADEAGIGDAAAGESAEADGAAPAEEPAGAEEPAEAGEPAAAPESAEAGDAPAPSDADHAAAAAAEAAMIAAAAEMGGIGMGGPAFPVPTDETDEEGIGALVGGAEVAGVGAEAMPPADGEPMPDADAQAGAEAAPAGEPGATDEAAEAEPQKDPYNRAALFGAAALAGAAAVGGAVVGAGESAADGIGGAGGPDDDGRDDGHDDRRDDGDDRGPDAHVDEAAAATLTGDAWWARGEQAAGAGDDASTAGAEPGTADEYRDPEGTAGEAYDTAADELADQDAAAAAATAAAAPAGAAIPAAEEAAASTPDAAPAPDETPAQQPWVLTPATAATAAVASAAVASSGADEAAESAAAGVPGPTPGSGGAAGGSGGPPPVSRGDQAKGIVGHFVRLILVAVAGIALLAALVGVGYVAGKLLVRPGEPAATPRATVAPQQSPGTPGASLAPDTSAQPGTPTEPGASADPGTAASAEPGATTKPSAKPTPKPTAKPKPTPSPRPSRASTTCGPATRSTGSPGNTA